jgi:hypothetical protein
MQPEAVFHMFFQTSSNPDPDVYRGSVVLTGDQIGTLPVSLLTALQAMLNDALASEDANIPQHVKHDPCHFGYVESVVPNAIAFCFGGYCFIGTTVPLLDRFWHASSRLAESPAVVERLSMTLADDAGGSMSIEQRIAAAMFRLQLFFVVLHEFVHIVHGHVIGDDVFPYFADEVAVHHDGDLDDQAAEADADGYALFLLLSQVLDGAGERRHLLDTLGLSEKPRGTQDEALLSSALMAAAAFFFASPSEPLTNDGVYTLTHPPQAARMSLIFAHARRWCSLNRQGLVDWLSASMLRALFGVVASAMWGVNGGDEWSDQIAFLRSAEGAEYYRLLTKTLDAQMTGSHRG